MRFTAPFAASLLMATVLGACSSNIKEAFDSRQNVGPCPSSASVYEAARIVEFADGEQVYTNIAYSGEIIGVQLYCRYVADEPLLAEVEIDFALGKGPKGEARRHVYPYFVSVTRRNSRVLAKEYFAVEADFRNSDVVGKREIVNRIIIPRADEGISGANFEILVGFDLTEDQLTFNRAGKRFRLNAGAPAEE